MSRQRQTAAVVALYVMTVVGVIAGIYVYRSGVVSGLYYVTDY